MAEPVRYIYGTEAQILALEPSDTNWFEMAFYYPSDKDYFYQLVQGVMKKYAGGLSFGVGVLLNDAVIGGSKTLIEVDDVLFIPINYEYNVSKLTVDGIINNEGIINMI